MITKYYVYVNINGTDYPQLTLGDLTQPPFLPNPGEMYTAFSPAGASANYRVVSRIFMLQPNVSAGEVYSRVTLYLSNST